MLSLGLQALGAQQSACVTANNFMNAQYTVGLQIGNPAQTLSVVPDTGSSDLLVASTECVGCVGAHTLYDRNKSTTFLTRGSLVESQYGQGRVLSRVSYDTVALGGMAALNQSILLMEQNELKNFDEASYDGVMGLGPQQNARTEDEDASLMTTWKTSTVAICFGQGDSEPGRLDVGEGIPGLKYTELPSQGEYHWGVHLDSMAVGGSKVGEIVCSPRCAVIVDSGTSLIALPTMLLEEILETVGEVREDCSNLHQLPNITIQMSGSAFTLPPQIYVARMRDVSDASALRFSPFGFKHIERKQAKLKQAWGTSSTSASQSSDVCVPAFVEMDAFTNQGPMIILGIPFLRAYAAKFDRSSKTIGLAELPMGASTCTTCAHGGAASVVRNADLKGSAVAHELLPPRPMSSGGRISTPLMSMKNLRLPWWAARATAKPGQKRANSPMIL